jgi:hypothetical protein
VRTIGIDPGTNGAIAYYSADFMVAWDIPTDDITVGGKQRKRIDKLGLGEMLDMIRDCYFPDRIVIEKVSGMPGQSGMFEFGYTVGCIHQALADRKMAFDVVTPAQWKKDVKAPKDKKECVAKCDALWPSYRSLFRTSTGKGGLRPDRAEAALLAYWAAGGRGG